MTPCRVHFIKTLAFMGSRAPEGIGNPLTRAFTSVEQTLDRETILAEAATRYCYRQGADKIASSSSNSKLNANGARTTKDPLAQSKLRS